jgi:4-hydroxybenzoate polyprenyltransferase
MSEMICVNASVVVSRQCSKKQWRYPVAVPMTVSGANSRHSEMDTTSDQLIENDIPLVLDVDGTLLRTDLLYESFWAALGHDLTATLLATATNWQRPQRLKHALMSIARPRIDLLPVRAAVLNMAREAVEAGRSVHLVSGSNQELIDDLASQLELPGLHFGSDCERNLTDAAKAAFLKDRFGAGGYDYAGNAQADLMSWAGARKIIVVEPSTALARKIKTLGKPIKTFADGWGISDVIRELRPHQWVKNLLLFVPLLASHTLLPTTFLTVCLAAVAFSIGASSIYVLNDLLDLEADRSHPEKKFRPIASGDLPTAAAMQVSALLALTAVLLALSASPQVALLTLAYMGGSLSYSLWFKKRRWLDLIALTCLFLLRILTGAVAANSSATPQLLALSFAVFFTLACVKRLTALSRMRQRDHLPGRGYSFHDLATLERASFTSAGLSGVIFLAYVWEEHASGLYSAPVVASLAAVPLMLWLFRMVRLSIAGKEDYDPVRFVLHDRAGLMLAVLGATLLVLAV